ncbi:uncharacterized protein TNCV_1088471 [Trichonephila clavipes]|uniref:Uncharacterized protein n=1 Tax=Trichonephila clavipes TaxID=2585209 RepID=A0A8X6SRR2_TRICX|nr:uncharacterized protein TNCV_1088471 [Trichonephila clavipes]
MGLQTGMPGFDAHQIPSGYVLVKSVSPKVLWTESRVQGNGEYFPPLQFHAKIMEVEIGGVAIYRPFGEFRRANSYCHLYDTQGQRRLSPCHDEFRGFRSDYVRQVALATPRAFKKTDITSFPPEEYGTFYEHLVDRYTLHLRIGRMHE